MCRGYLLRFEQLKLEIDKHEGTVVEMGKTGINSVKLENGNSNMVLGLRNRAMKMIDCVYDLKDGNLRQIAENEMIIKQEMEVIKSNECKLRKRLDMVQYEKEDLAKLLEVKKEVTRFTTRSIDDHERLVDQRGYRQRSMSVEKQVHFEYVSCTTFRELNKSHPV